MPQDPPDRSSNLGRNVNVAAKALRQAGERLLSKHGSNLADWIALRCLEAHPGCSQRELAEVLGVEGATMTHHLDRMEKSGLIQRKKDPDDRRVTRVTMSSRGKRTMQRLEPVMAESNARLVRGVSTSDLATFERVLGRIVKNAEGEETEGAADDK